MKLVKVKTSRANVTRLRVTESRQGWNKAAEMKLVMMMCVLHAGCGPQLVQSPAVDGAERPAAGV